MRAETNSMTGMDAHAPALGGEERSDEAPHASLQRSFQGFDIWPAPARYLPGPAALTPRIRQSLRRRHRLASPRYV